MEHIKFWICATLAGLGPARTNRLLQNFDSIERIFTLSLSELQDAGIPKNIAQNILQWEELPWKKEYDFCLENNISVVTLSDSDYPSALKEIYDPPSALYVKGALPPKESILIAIVGTRNPSIYGIQMAEKFAEELSYLGFIVVSGMARGIDTAAHRGTLKANGITAAITGSGFRYCYPPENRRLSQEIERRGAVITEFLSFVHPEPCNFPRRNRIVSGMSRGVLVIEAGQRSGALITANIALEQGREVFALPGRIDALTSKGTNQLLKEGALLIEDTKEIVEALNLEIKKNEIKPSGTATVLSPEEARVFNIFINRRRAGIEELLLETGIEQPALFQILLSLVIKDLVTELPGKIYEKK